MLGAASIESRALPQHIETDRNEVLDRANLLVVAEVLSAKEPSHFFAGEDYRYAIRILDILGGASAPPEMEVTYAHYRVHKRGDMIVHPLYYSSGKELSLVVGQRYVLFLNTRDDSELVDLVRAEGVEERDRLTAAWNKKFVFLGTVTSIRNSPVVGSNLNWIVETRIDKRLTGTFGGDTFSFRVHSPARSGLEVGQSYTVKALKAVAGYTVDPWQWNR